MNDASAAPSKSPDASPLSDIGVALGTLQLALAALLKALSETKLEVVPTYRRLHSEGKMTHTKGKICPQRTKDEQKQYVCWEFQLVYKTDIPAILAPAAKAGVLCALFDCIKTNDWELSTREHIVNRYVDREAWPISPGGTSDPDEHHVAEKYPKYCAVETDFSMYVQLAIIFNKATGKGPSKPLEFNRHHQVPSREYRARTTFQDLVPSSDESDWEMSLGNGEHHPDRESDWVIITAPTGKIHVGETFFPYHCGSDGLEGSIHDDRDIGVDPLQRSELPRDRGAMATLWEPTHRGGLGIPVASSIGLAAVTEPMAAEHSRSAFHRDPIPGVTGS